MASWAAVPELAQIEALVTAAGSAAQGRVACQVTVGALALPVWVVTLGNPDPALPALGLFGGVHGLERIGTDVVLTALRNLVSRLRWDRSLDRLLDGLRLVLMPLVNPGGYLRGTRANPQGVDLMRNAPVTCDEGAPWLVGGQRLSPGLPWYRGAAGSPMAPEAQALCDTVEQELLGRPFAMALDCHSGFGMRDRLWFPYAHSVQPVAHLAELRAFSRLLDESLVHHRYLFEPQSRQYLAHGDLWDHLYLRSRARPMDVFLPLTLEMGSWLWVRKNLRQAFSRLGLFNPQISHRRERVLRRHMGLVDLLMRAAHSHRHWRPLDADARARDEAEGLAHWYRRP